MLTLACLNNLTHDQLCLGHVYGESYKIKELILVCVLAEAISFHWNAKLLKSYARYIAYWLFCRGPHQNNYKSCTELYPVHM